MGILVHGRGAGRSLEDIVRENRGLHPKLWMQALTYWEMMYGITGSGASRYYAKERVRRDWYYKGGLWGGYKPKPYNGPVVLKFSLWEQAEARHKNDKLTKIHNDEAKDYKA